MAISAGEPTLLQATTSLTALVDQMKARAEKVLVGSEQACHQLERERIHLLLIDDAEGDGASPQARRDVPVRGRLRR